MQPGQPDVIEQIGTSNAGNVMEPASGSYGAVKETADLEQMAGGAQASPNPGPMDQTPSPAGPTGMSPATPPSGAVPGGILRPTTDPDTPVSTPLGGNAPSPTATVSGARQRLALLDSLANSGTVSDETREWAKDQLQKLASAGR